MQNKRFVLRFRKENRDIFLAIKNGRKKIETRAASPKFGSIKTSDKPREINPKAFSEKELTKMFYSSPGYREKIKKFGLVAIELAQK